MITKTCKYCKKDYLLSVRYQTPGCRDWEDEVCPYCHRVNKSSMEWEFTTYEIDNSK